MAAAAKTSALDLFNSISIDEVREQIATVDGEIAALEKKRDSLRTIEKAIDIRDNGKPARGGWSAARKAKAAKKAAAGGDDSLQLDDEDEDDDDPAPAARPAATGFAGRQPSAETVELRDRLHKILRLHGPMKVGDLSRDTKVEYGKVSNALTGPQFRKMDDGRYTVR